MSWHRHIPQWSAGLPVANEAEVLVMIGCYHLIDCAVGMVVGHAVAVAAVGTVVVEEAVGTGDIAVIDIVWVGNLMLLGYIADSASIAAVGRLHYLVDAVDSLHHTTKCNV